VLRGYRQRLAESNGNGERKHIGLDGRFRIGPDTVVNFDPQKDTIELDHFADVQTIDAIVVPKFDHRDRLMAQAHQGFQMRLQVGLRDAGGSSCNNCRRSSPATRMATATTNSSSSRARFQVVGVAVTY
jgi:hypothetical protein